MGYSRDTWRQRIAERTDLSTQVVHLTREIKGATKEVAGQEVLFSIIEQKCLKGSSTASAFICGNRAAVCFQDAPLAAICQNVFFEQKYRAANPGAKLRYKAIGLAFSKEYIFLHGGRPVIYEKTQVAKQMLPKSEWWRIVNYDLSAPDKFVDWTHEREWRIPGNFTFELKEATLLFTNERIYHSFRKLCRKKQAAFLDEIKGVVVMDNLLY